MNVNLAPDSLKIVVKGLILLQQKKSLEYSRILRGAQNPRDIAVITAKEDLMDVSNLVGIFSEGL